MNAATWNKVLWSCLAVMLLLNLSLLYCLIAMGSDRLAELSVLNASEKPFVYLLGEVQAEHDWAHGIRRSLRLERQGMPTESHEDPPVPVQVFAYPPDLDNPEFMALMDRYIASYNATTLGLAGTR